MQTLSARPIDLVELGTRAGDFARHTRAPATERAYGSDWRDFAAWCGSAGQLALPAEPTTVGAYLIDRAGSRKVPLDRRLAGTWVRRMSTGDRQRVRRDPLDPRTQGTP